MDSTCAQTPGRGLGVAPRGAPVHSELATAGGCGGVPATAGGVLATAGGCGGVHSYAEVFGPLRSRRSKLLLRRGLKTSV